MTRSIALLLAIFLFLGTPVVAATRVQSGDHIGFVRLVVYFDRGQQWSLEKSDGGFRLEAPGLGEGYDVSRVFEMIKQDRITSISSTEDDLVIELACQCVASTTILSGGQLVIDFADPPTLATSETDLPISTEESVDAIDAVSPDQPGAPEFDIAQSFAPDMPPIELPDTLPAPTMDVDLEPVEDTPIASAEELAEFRKRLLENLGRSASLSLVDLAEEPSDAEQALQLQVSTGIERPDRARISNAVDDARDPRSDGVRPLERATCPSPAEFQIGDWGSAEGFSEHISGIRRSIIGEFDEVDSQQVLTLARSYLHYGLTDEARHVLSQFKVAPQQAATLTTLSRLIDQTPSESGSQLAAFDHCGGAILPWRLLDQPRTASVSEEQRQIIAAEFSKWPKPLQESLGPQLMKVLKMRGFETTAAFLNTIIGDGRPAVETELVGTAAPFETIKEGVEAGDPEALADLLRKGIDENSEISERYLELASAFEKETAGTELSDRLHSLRIEAYAYRGDVAQLMEVMKRNIDKRHYSPEVVTRATSHILAKSGSAEVTIFASFLLRNGQLSELPDELVFKIADQLVAAGLPNLADDVLSARSGLAAPASLEARLAWSDRQTDRLSDLIAGLGDLADRDRGVNEVLNSGGVDALPANLLGNLSQETQERVAWAGSDWANVTSDGPEGSISKLIIAIESLELADTPLTTAKEIQGKATETRALLSEVLGPQDQ